jgi:hypothetical protein
MLACMWTAWTFCINGFSVAVSCMGICWSIIHLEFSAEMLCLVFLLSLLFSWLLWLYCLRYKAVTFLLIFILCWFRSTWYFLKLFSSFVLFLNYLSCESHRYLLFYMILVIVVSHSLNISFCYHEGISGDALNKEWSVEKILCTCLISRTQNIAAGGCKELCLCTYSANNMYRTRFHVPAVEHNFCIKLSYVNLPLRILNESLI